MTSPIDRTRPKSGARTQKSRCRHCQKMRRRDELLNGEYCMFCVMGRSREVAAGRSLSHLQDARRCLIPGCLNHTDEGNFVGDLCSPCHAYVVLNSGTHSQAYRNELAKSQLRKISGCLSDNQEARLLLWGRLGRVTP